MSIPRFIAIILCIGVMSCMISQVNAEQFVIPNWIKNNAQWWYQNQISDSEFIKGIQYLIQNKIMIVPSSTTVNAKNKIPSWIKNDAGWWANGTISDNEFVSGIQYLISSGIIVVNSTSDSNQCDKFTTAAEKETCQEQLDYDKKIKNYMEIAKPTVIGPITFYYVNSETQKSNEGKTILTIHFVVQNNSNNPVTLTCQPPSCHYSLSDGQNEIPYITNTLVYGSLTLVPNAPKLLDWTFYGFIEPSKNYSFLVKEIWGSGSIPIKIS